MNLNERIKFVRKQAGMTQAKLASFLKVSEGTIKRYEKNASKIPVEIVSKIALFCNADDIWLFTGKKIESVDKKKHKETQGDGTNLTKIIIQHQDIIKRFKDPEMAKEINEDLIELEKLDDNLYKDVAKHIKSSVNAARVIKGGEKKHAEELLEKKRANGK